MLFSWDLTVRNFRNHDRLSLSQNTPLLALYGPNGSGKTSLLEALSLFQDGRGFRGASVEDLQKQGSLEPWSLALTLNLNEGERNELVLRRQSMSPGQSKKEYLVNRESLKGAPQGKELSILTLIPEMDQILCESKASRRNYIDVLTNFLCPEHKRHLWIYTKTLKQRLAYLNNHFPDGYAQESFDPLWLEVLEERLARYGALVHHSRQDLITRLNECFLRQHDTRNFLHRLPLPLSQIHCSFAEVLRQDGEIGAQQRWSHNRILDQQKQQTSFGPHRSDILIHHLQTNTPLTMSSTGEQKAFLIAFTLTLAELVDSTSSPQLLLLDDCLARLDSAHQEALLHRLSHLNFPVVLSATSLEHYPINSPKLTTFCTSKL